MNAKTMFTVPAPPGKTYLPYQLAFIKYALGDSGTLLADEMGLGKTIQAIGLINAMKAKRVLIVAPAGLCLNWRNELDDWLVKLDDQIIDVVSYNKAETYSDMNEAVRPFNDGRLYWDLLIVDEAHYIKNPQAQRSRIIKMLAANAKRKVLLTGTPIENRPVELWPLLQLVAAKEFDKPVAGEFVIAPEWKKSHPGEGPAFWEFAKRYCGLKRVSFRGRRGKASSSWDFSGATNLQELNTRLRKSCMVRRLKQDVLEELPSKRRQVIVLESKGIDDSQLLPELDEDNYTESVKRLIADKILFEEYAKKRHEQALKKVNPCLQFIGTALDSGQKIIVFAHHQDVITKLVDGIRAEQGEESCVVVTGKTHVADRGAAVKRFQEDATCKVFVGSIGAAGVGITLTAASHVIFAELDPVPGRMNQAEDRAHRIGQKESVLIQHLVFNGSLCARIAKILVKKQDIINQVIDG